MFLLSSTTSGHDLMTEQCKCHHRFHSSELPVFIEIIPPPSQICFRLYFRSSVTVETVSLEVNCSEEYQPKYVRNLFFFLLFDFFRRSFVSFKLTALCKPTLQRMNAISLQYCTRIERYDFQIKNYRNPAYNEMF